MIKVSITQDRFKPFGYYMSQEINGLTFQTSSIFSIKDIKKRGFEIVSRKDWKDGEGYKNVNINS